MVSGVARASAVLLVMAVPPGTAWAQRAQPVSTTARTIHVRAAAETIQSAIDAAGDGDVVLVGPGTYTENIDFLGKAISVVGMRGAHATTLRGGGPVVRFHNAEGSGSILQGFTIENGFTTSEAGAGISALTTGGVAAAPTIRDCIVQNNTSHKEGGGVAGNPRMERCTIVENTSWISGGGVSGEPHLSSCVVARNTVTDLFSFGGGGLFASGPAARVEDCIFLDNLATQGAAVGGGIAGPVQAYRSVFWRNRTFFAFCPDDGGGGAISQWTPEQGRIESCVIIGNSGTGFSPGGVLGDYVVVNSIVRGNTNRGTPYNLAFANASYCNIEGFYAGTGNFDASPGLVAPAEGGFHLRAASANIDAGDPALLDPDGTRSDVGAFPYQRFYVTENTSVASWTDPSWPSVSLQTGGTQRLTLLAGNDYAGFDYRVVGSFSGTLPGFSVKGVHVPLNPDFYTSYSLANPNTPPLSGFAGTLNANGMGTAIVELAPEQALSLAGVVIHHAYAVFHPTSGRLETVSNAVALGLTL